MNSKKVLVILLVFTVIIAAAFSFFRLFSAIEVKKAARSSSTMPAYRFVCIYSGSSEYYKYALNEGLKKASEENNLWVKLYKFKSFETDKHCEAFDMAIAEKVDGIITNLPSGGDLQSYIERANAKYIPVVMIENDLPTSRRISFIGTNSYAYGMEAGKLLAAASNASAKAAIFNSQDTAARLNLKNQGFYNSINNYPLMGAEVFYVNEPSIIEFTTIAQNIFLNHPQIDSFFCSDAESTMGVVRAMIEFNKTNRIVIGSGDTNEILKYIKNGIIYASVVEDPVSIGYLSVINLLRYKREENISQVVNPDIIVITKDNADAMMIERGLGNK